MRERGLEDRATGAFHLLEHFVRRGFADEDEQRRTVRGQGRGQILHELIVDPQIDQCSRHRARRRTDREAQERIQEQQSDQHSPESPAGCARGRQIDGLVKLDFALGVFGHGHGVLQVDDLPGRPRERVPAVLRERIGGRPDGTHRVQLRPPDEIEFDGGNGVTQFSDPTTVADSGFIRAVQADEYASRSRARPSSTSGRYRSRGAAPGTYTYVCQIHDGMEATVTVD